MQIIRRLPCTRRRIARCFSLMQSSSALTFTLDWAYNYLVIVLVSSTVHLLEVAEAAQLLFQEQPMNLVSPKGCLWNREQVIFNGGQAETRFRKNRFDMTTRLMMRCFLGTPSRGAVKA